MKRVLKRILLVLGILVGAILLFAIGLITYLSITEYRPADVEEIEVRHQDGVEIESAFSGGSFRVLSWNVGYCALGEDSDFFMDGGKQVRPGSKDTVRSNMEGIRDTIASLENAPDFCMLQEVDEDSKRSFRQNELDFFTDSVVYPASAFAYNYKCKYVPYPWPPLGKVQSGLLTLSSREIVEAKRIALPCPFKWPVSIANLKRCLLVTRIPIDGAGRDLVLVNLHLEAYDDGDGKIEQTKKLLNFLYEEYEKGNYVVAGGDWNQVFPGTEETYPNTHRDLWTPGVLNEADIAEGWQLVWDRTENGATCRLLNQPYDPADKEGTQYYVIDGFLISPNLELVSVDTVDEAGFVYSDHNPVLLELRFAG